MFKGIVGRILVFLAAVAALTAVVGLLLPMPAPVASVNLPAAPAPKAAQLAWPAYGQSAVGAQGYGILASNGQSQPAPTASIAKVITALAVLKKKPLTVGSDGPTITLGQTDVADYQQYVSQDGSVVPVQAGEQITERQVLEAMLLPSANNMAYSLAAWAFGSLDAYTTYANQFVKTLGMDHTTVADASGFSPNTVSTADDLVRLGLTAMQNPVVAQIVNESSANIPVAGTVNNVNLLLGTNGIIGIKTGNTDQAGGCFLFAAKHTISGQTITIVGAVMSAPNLYYSMRDASTLLSSVDQNFKQEVLVPANTTVGSYKTTWGQTTMIYTKTATSLLVWQAQPVTFKESFSDLKLPLSACETVGTLTAYSGPQTTTTQLLNQSQLKAPTVFWRLVH